MQRSFTFVFLLVVCLVCLGPLAAQTAPTPEPVGLRPDAPQYALHGPYWVGTQRFRPESASPFEIRAWYPALNPDGVAESVTYQTRAGNIQGHALEAAAPDLEHGPYPLVILDHGFSGVGEVYSYLGEHLASQGFVVLAPHHVHDALTFIYGSVIIRLNEIRDTIAYADLLTQSDETLRGVIDTDRIGVLGHSFGAIAAYGAGGAPLNWDSMQQYCREITDDPGCRFDLNAVKARMLQTAGLQAEPEGLWPPITDPRVDAIVPISGSADPYGPEGLAQLTVPALIVYGSEDWLELPSDQAVVGWMHPAYDWIGSTQKVRAIFEGAGHRIFLESPWSDNDPAWDRDQAHDITNHLVTAFLLSTLKGDAEATAALAPDAVAFPGIEYQAEGF